MMMGFNNKGVTITEVAISVAVIGAVMGMLKGGIAVMNYFSRQSALSQLQQEAHVILYDVAREIRNASRFTVVSPTRFEMRGYNTRAGYDITTNPTLFDETNITTTTYRFVNSGPNSFLEKTISIGGSDFKKTLLKGKIATPLWDKPISTSIPASIAFDNITSVKVLFRLFVPSIRAADGTPLIMEYTTDAMRRAE